MAQERVQTTRGGQFTLRSRARARDGKYQATFVITEHEWHGDVELKCYIGNLYATDEEAVAAGMDAAIAWLRDYRLVSSSSHS